LADEPTGNLDWQTSDAVVKLFEKINEEGKTVIMATHNLDIVKKFDKRVIHIEGGRIVEGKK
jgi:cell division transport system ATP-binding protein